MATSLLLANGTVLVHDQDDHVVPTKADVLVQGNTIAHIAPGIARTGVEEIIDCTDMIISPGFVDCHQHVWQTQLKGRHADHTLMEYMPTGNMQSSNYTPEDVFFGELSGCMELIDAGTTTVVDHAHMSYSPEATDLAVSATITSGIRSIFGFCPTFRVTSWKPLTMADSFLDDWVLSSLHSLAAGAPFGPNGRVSLGVAFDGWALPDDMVHKFMKAVKQDLGIKLITTHAVHSPMVQPFSLTQKIHSLGLLDQTILLSHATGADEEDVRLLKQAGAHIASTPSTELQMGHGAPVCFEHTLPDMFEISSLGNDCHSNCTASIPNEMRLALMSARAARDRDLATRGKIPRHTWRSVEEAFNLGTIMGARAVGMEDKIGSIEIGKRADLVVFNGLTPAMLGAAQHDPTAAIVHHSSPRDLSWVIVDGVVRKRDGQLEKVTIDSYGGAKDVVGKEVLTWDQVARSVLESREKIQEKIGAIDLEDALKKTLESFGVGDEKYFNE